jgi:hypothetical protein
VLVSFLQLLRPRRRTDGFGPERPGVRRFPAITAALAAAALAVPAPVPGAPITVLVAAPVGEGAQQTMPAALWLRLVSEYVGPAKIVADVESTMPDQERCRAAHASYALLATFDRAPRLAGTAQDTDRAYAVARLTLRDCATGVVSPPRIIRLESDPVAESDRTGDLAAAERQWARPVQVALAHEPLALVKAAPIVTHAARVSRVRDGVVFLDGAAGFVVSQVVFDYAGADGQAHVPVQLVVTEVDHKYVATTILGRGTPRTGDYVAASAPTPTPSPTPTPTPTPSETPIPTPSETPSSTPSPTPSETPSSAPSPMPSPTPSETPSSTPSETPSSTPSETPSSTPSETPSSVPAATPSAAPRR